MSYPSINRLGNSSTTKTATARSGGVGLVSLLGLLFVGLKLGGVGAVATWPWWLVLLPFWGGFALLLGILIVAGIVLLIIGGVAAVRKS